MTYRHALRVKKYYGDDGELDDFGLYAGDGLGEPYIKREISRSHILRAI